MKSFVLTIWYLCVNLYTFSDVLQPWIPFLTAIAPRGGIHILSRWYSIRRTKFPVWAIELFESILRLLFLSILSLSRKVCPIVDHKTRIQFLEKYVRVQIAFWHRPEYYDVNSIFYTPKPPVTSKQCPVIYDDSGDASNTMAAAASSTLPALFRGVFFLFLSSKFARPSLGTPSGTWWRHQYVTRNFTEISTWMIWVAKWIKYWQ